MHRLLVLRHAKSDWTAGAADHERPLNDRGRRSATAVGEELARIGEVPDVVLCSSARRARQTLELAATAGSWGSEVREMDVLYGTSVEGTLDVVRQAPEVERVMLVGHEPTWSAVVATLTGAGVAMRTATVAGIDLAVDRWDAVGSDTRGEIAYVIQSRHLLS